MLSKTSRVISSKARNLAECLSEKGLLGETKFPSSQPTLMLRIGSARDPSALRFVGMTLSLRF